MSEMRERERAVSSVFMLNEDYLDSYTAAASLLVGTDPEMGYETLLSRLLSRQIYYGDAYLRAFADVGVIASLAIPECDPLQRRWAEEHGVIRPPDIISKRPFRRLWSRLGLRAPTDAFRVRAVEEQVRLAKPDVLWVFSGVRADQEAVERWGRHASRSVLWWSCARESWVPYRSYDVILSSIEPLVAEFRKEGYRAELMPHAFDERALERVPPVDERVPRVAFVGNLSGDHADRIEFLEHFSRSVELDFYGHGVEHLPAGSALRKRARGPVWGDELYRVYREYAVVIHKNIDVAGVAPSAKRLFEATGMGACLLVERSRALGQLFEPDVEVATYGSTNEAIARGTELLENVALSRSIAERGQRRTLSDHSYRTRAREFVSIVSSS